MKQLSALARQSSDLAASSLPILPSLSKLQQLAAGRRLAGSRELHALLLTSGLLSSSPAALTSLISLYSNSSSPVDALAAFSSSPNPPNLVAWNAAISALSSNSLSADALRLFRRLRTNPALSPDRFTFPCIIKALTDLGDIIEIRKIHALLFKFGLDSEIFAASAVVNAYLKMEFVDCAEKVFHDLPERDVVIWNSMVNGFAQTGRFTEAKEYFAEMLREGIVPTGFTITGVLSVFTSTADFRAGRRIHAFVVKTGCDLYVSASNSLIDLYGKCHGLEEAELVFESMLERDVFSWNSMISASQYSGDHVKALQLFGRMLLAGVQPDAITATAILPAISQIAALASGQETHAYLLRHGITNGDVFLDNALIDMYAKCGSIDDARVLFDQMPQQDLASWNIMIDAYASHGRGQDALELFNSMTAAPNEVTIVGVLSACSHGGMVEAGREIFRRMEAGEYGISPAAEHYLCMVDMMGRAGMLEAAKEIAAKAEGAAGAKGWRAYVTACKEKGEVDRAVEVAERVVEMEPEWSGGWVMAANAYGWAGKYEELAAVRGQMRRKGVRKVVGCSWVEVAGDGVHAFVTGDKGHPRAEAIYAAVHGIAGWVRDGGCVE
ncbi:Pentatricopeptide repeat-containing protein [Apostasia shenzhenica]|uniref:Pentatricopeptide repeat-containing protein n=1 Tax=Apostasia shenzhenica TaxID=1088818 RepID=A0A2I0A6I5_9ASPA|nr:Pentatricopeptide repeat-containing protein [Apostasia shenzhenica]